MTDIFTLINQLPDDDIRLQLAFFDSVTLTSAAKETGSRLLTMLIYLMRLKRPDTGWLMCLQMLPIHLHRCLQTS